MRFFPFEALSTHSQFSDLGLNHVLDPGPKLATECHQMPWSVVPENTPSLRGYFIHLIFKSSSKLLQQNSKEKEGHLWKNSFGLGILDQRM